MRNLLKDLNYIIYVCLIAIFLTSCGDKDKKKPVYNSLVPEETQQNDNSFASSGDEIAVPFRTEGGIKLVPVKVNGIGFDMIFDTGCSVTLISAAEANYLYQKGLLTNEDILGSSQVTIADGSIVDNLVVNLKEVIIDDKILCTDVTATVSKNVNASLLLGNEILDRLANIKIDNENQQLIFKMK